MVPVLSIWILFLKARYANLPTAGLYGSGMLNNRFLEEFFSYVEENNISFIPRGQRRTATTVSQLEIEYQARKEFETHKKRFGNDQEKKRSKPMFISMPGLEDIYGSYRRPGGLGGGGVNIPR